MFRKLNSKPGTASLSRSGRPGRAGLLLALAGAMIGQAPLVAGEPAPPAATARDPACAEMDLYLSVSINGRDTGKLAHFSYCPARKHMSATRRALEAVGLRLPFGSDRRIRLDAVPGLNYRYDPDRQSIAISVPDRLMKPAVISAYRGPGPVTPDRSLGAVLNYALTGALSWGDGTADPGLNSLSAALDGWVYSPLGVLRSTGFYQSQGGSVGDGRFVRLETSYRLDLPRRAITATLGDFQSATLPWGRSIRLGGFQIRRNFALRGDLVPQQLFAFSGAAAVPSTVDVFINDNRSFSTQVAPGPFRIQDIAPPSGSGDAVIRIRGADGRETSRRVSFFAARDLIKRGLLDFSLGAGHPREAYGQQSARYAGQIAYSASLRYGLGDRVTLQAHAEGKPGLLMSGLGFTTTPFDRAETTLALGTSRYEGQSSAFVYGTLRTRLRGVEINLSVLHAQKGFADLAYATGVDYLGAAALAGSKSLLEFPRAQEVLGVSFPSRGKLRNMGLSLVHSRRANSDDLIIAASYSHALSGRRGSIDFYASHNLRSDDSHLALSLALTWGGHHYARTGITQDGSGSPGLSAYLARTMSDRVGDYGYSLQVNQQGDGATVLAQAEYRGRHGKIGADASQVDGTTYLRPRFDGALVLAGGRLAAGNSIHDSFALVDVGAPGIPVSFQNRRVTATGPSGRALVTGLTSFHRNRISVDPTAFPLGVTPGVTAADIVPARNAGVLVDLRADSRPSALVSLRDAQGRALPVGAAAYLNGGKTPFAIGYDGQAWLEGLKPQNLLRVELPNGPCTARFPYAPAATLQVQIHDVECRP